MDRFDYQHLDGMTIESVGTALRLDYSEPDQGGAQLLHRFRIPMKGNPEMESGYAGDPKLTKKEIAFAELPPRVILDAETWLTEQCEMARSNGNNALVKALSDFQERLRRK